MSRSRRKTPIFGNTGADTDHPWKKASARKLRRGVKQVLQATQDGDNFSGKRWDLVNPWSSEKDGKHYCTAPDPRWMRK
jgi:hypothetical protein